MNACMYVYSRESFCIYYSTYIYIPIYFTVEITLIYQTLFIKYILDYYILC